MTTLHILIALTLISTLKTWGMTTAAIKIVKSSMIIEGKAALTSAHPHDLSQSQGCWQSQGMLVICWSVLSLISPLLASSMAISSARPTRLFLLEPARVMLALTWWPASSPCDNVSLTTCFQDRLGPYLRHLCPFPHPHRTPGPPQPPDIGTVASSVLSMHERATPFTLQQQKWWEVQMATLL